MFSGVDVAMGKKISLIVAYQFSISYSTVALYIGIMKVWGFWPKILTPKPA